MSRLIFCKCLIILAIFMPRLHADDLAMPRMTYANNETISIDSSSLQSTFRLFELDCQARGDSKNPIYNSCLLSDLFKTYTQRSKEVEELFVTELSIRPQWTFIDVVSGAFNLKLSLNPKQKSVKPIVDMLALHVAISNELKNYKKFLDLQKTTHAQIAKRMNYPQLMWFFGGLTPLAKISAYADALSCEFHAPPAGPVSFAKECEAIQLNLKASLRSLANTTLQETNRVINAIKDIADKPEYSPSVSLSTAVRNTTTLLVNIANLKSEEIYEWTNTVDSCNKRSKSSLHKLCERLSSSLVVPEDLSNPALMQAVVAAVGLFETSVVLQKTASYKKARASDLKSISEFSTASSFVMDAKTEVSESLVSFFITIRDHYLQYDPSSIIDENFEQRELWVD